MAYATEEQLALLQQSVNAQIGVRAIMIRGNGVPTGGGVDGIFYYDMTGNKLYVHNGTAWEEVGAGTGGGGPAVTDYELVTFADSPKTVVAGKGYLVDSTDGPIEFVMPTTPAVNDVNSFIPVAPTYSVNAVTVRGNTKSINGIACPPAVDPVGAGDLNVAIDNITFDMIYVDNTRGWIVVAAGSAVYLQQATVNGADIIAIRDATGTTPSLLIDDRNKLVRTTSAADGILTLPASTAVDIGWQTNVLQGDLGYMTFQIAGGSGDTIIALDNYIATMGKGAIVTVIKVAEHVWWIGGGLGIAA